MTDEQIAELRRLEKAATHGPWRWWTSNSMRRLSSDPSGKDGDVLRASIATDGVADVVVSEQDQDLIAAARNALPLLLDERDALLKALRDTGVCK